MWEHRGKVWLALSINLVVVAVAVGLPILLGDVVKAILSPGHFGLRVMLAIYFVVPVIQGSVLIGSAWVTPWVGRSISRILRIRTFDTLLHLNWDALQAQRPGDLVRMLTLEAGQIGEVYVQQALLPALSQMILLVASLSFMIHLQPEVGMLACSLLPVLWGITAWVRWMTSRTEQRAFESRGHVNSYLHEILSNIRTVQLFQTEQFEMARFDSIISDYQEKDLRASAARTVGRTVFQQIFGTWSTAAVLVVMASRTTHPSQVGTLVALIAYVPNVYSAWMKLEQIRLGGAWIGPVVARLNEIWKLPSRRIVDPSPPKPDSSGPIIEFRQVTFRYPGDRGGLSNISFAVQPTSRIVIVGPSGAGKSILFDLICGFERPENGTISVFGLSPADHHANLLPHLSRVDPQMSLWNASVQDNILYGSQHDTVPQWVTDVCELNGMLDRFPRGLSTIVGEHGEQLSAGERQRVLLARAIIRRPAIFLLDEATSALDVLTENRIWSKLRDALPSSTIIAITHRIALTRDADQVMVIEGQALGGMASPNELRAINRTYARMVEAAAGNSDH